MEEGDRGRTVEVFVHGARSSLAFQGEGDAFLGYGGGAQSRDGRLVALMAGGEIVFERVHVRRKLGDFAERDC